MQCTLPRIGFVAPGLNCSPAVPGILFGASLYGVGRRLRFNPSPVLGVLYATPNLLFSFPHHCLFKWWVLAVVNW
jgi:hypothetical protein